MSGGQIVWLRSEATWAVALTIVGFVAVLFWAYARHRGDPKRLWACLLKIAGVSLLALSLLEPTWIGRHAKPGANTMVVLVDQSQSMRVGERGVVAQSELASWLSLDPGSWRERLGKNFDLRVLGFGSSLRPLDDSTEIRCDETRSDLYAAMQSVIDRPWQRPLAGIILLSDGNATDVSHDTSSSWSVPVYPIADLSTTAWGDVSWSDVQVSRTGFETTPSRIQGTVSVRGEWPDELRAELLDGAGKVVQTQAIARPDGDKSAQVTFRFRPDQTGVQFYSVRLQATQRTRQTPHPEVTRENNQRTVVVERGGGPYRILYVGGRPNWEFKFLQRALEGDDEFPLVGLIRIANKQPRFTFRDQSGVTVNNRLFEGFTQEGESEQDQPVFLRIGVDSAEELEQGFPTSREALFAWDGLILDDLEAKFFSTEQLGMIRDFVTRRGGGLLFLGGLRSFHEGGYDQSPLRELMPVHLYAADPASSAPREMASDDSSQGADAANRSKWRWQVTRDGWHEEWARLRPTEDQERLRLEKMPGFGVHSAVDAAKPAAMVVAEVVGEGERSPALVVQRFGQGRVGALLLGDLWRWSLDRAEGDARDHEVFWRQLVRWLVIDAPGRAEIVGNDATQDSAVWQVQVRTAEFSPDENARVTVEVTDPIGRKLTFPADPSDESPGTYEADVPIQALGTCRAIAHIETSAGESLSTREHGRVVLPAEREWQNLEVRMDLLKAWAEKSGGEVVSVHDLDAWVEKVPFRKSPVVATHSVPLWHQTGWLLAALVCLVGEWSIRRAQGWA